MLHMIGLMPIVRTKAFDMVSDGRKFKLWIPPKNRFVTGDNEVQSTTPDRPMENIRPQNIYDALLIHRIDPDTELAVMESSYEILHDAKGHPILQDDYELVVIRKRSDKDAILSRKIIFSRTDLHPTRQYIYDEQGKLVTDARYAEYKNTGPGAIPASRVEWSRQLSDDAARAITVSSVLGGDDHWNPETKK